MQLLPHLPLPTRTQRGWPIVLANLRNALKKTRNGNSSTSSTEFRLKKKRRYPAPGRVENHGGTRINFQGTSRSRCLSLPAFFGHPPYTSKNKLNRSQKKLFVLFRPLFSPIGFEQNWDFRCAIFFNGKTAAPHFSRFCSPERRCPAGDVGVGAQRSTALRWARLGGCSLRRRQ